MLNLTRTSVEAIDGPALLGGLEDPVREHGGEVAVGVVDAEHPAHEAHSDLGAEVVPDEGHDRDVRGGAAGGEALHAPAPLVPLILPVEEVVRLLYELAAGGLGVLRGLHFRRLDVVQEGGDPAVEGVGPGHGFELVDRLPELVVLGRAVRLVGEGGEHREEVLEVEAEVLREGLGEHRGGVLELPPVLGGAEEPDLGDAAHGVRLVVVELARGVHEGHHRGRVGLDGGRQIGRAHV